MGVSEDKTNPSLDNRVKAFLSDAVFVTLTKSAMLSLRNDEPQSKSLIHQYVRFYESGKNPSPNLCNTLKRQITDFLVADPKFLYGKSRAFCFFAGAGFSATSAVLAFEKPELWPLALAGGFAAGLSFFGKWYLGRRSRKTAKNLINIMEESCRMDGYPEILIPYLEQSKDYMREELKDRLKTTNHY